eukprot:COSAG04_NODE_8725_length_938_cov_1.363528_1_plen_74_part_00
MGRLSPAFAAAAAAAAGGAPGGHGFTPSSSRVGPQLTRFLQLAPVVTNQLLVFSGWKMKRDIELRGDTEGLSP